VKKWKRKREKEKEKRERKRERERKKEIMESEKSYKMSVVKSTVSWTATPLWRTTKIKVRDIVV
jgi:hypothetical protein